MSYRVLSSPAPAPGLSPLPVRYEKTRLGLFHSVQDDGAIERVFVDPRNAAHLLVTFIRPEPAAYVSTDGGASWTRASLKLDAPDSDARAPTALSRTRLLAEVLFDSRDDQVAWARGRGRVFRTEDGGRSWAPTPLTGISALARGADGRLWAAGEGGLDVSNDGGRTWAHRPVRIPGAPEDTQIRVRSLLLDERDGRILLDVHDARSDAGSIDIATVLDGTSSAAKAALGLVDAIDAPPRALTAFGQGVTGVIESRDSGATWRRTGLALDAWLASADGALYAVAADPMIEAAFLVRAHPELAAALEQQLQMARVDAASLRSAFVFPGRDRLLAGPLATAPIFRSTDAGATWVRVLSLEPALAAALRTAVEAQIAAWEESAPQARAPERHPARAPRGGGGENAGPRGDGANGPRGTGRNRRSRGGAPSVPSAAAEPMRPSPRAPSAEAILAYLDPLRLLAHFNSGLALTGMSRSGTELYAWTVTQTHWDRLVDAAIAACDAEGEISLGPGMAPDGPGAFTLLRSTDGGASWSEIAPSPAPELADQLHEQRIAPYPAWLAAGPREMFVGLAARDRQGAAWLETWRDAF